MSLQEKYFFTFKAIGETPHRVEIWHDTTETITAVEVKGDDNPFSVSYPDADKFEPVRGSGCTINLVSETNMQFLGLYTAKMQEYQIRHYISGSLNWVGWLDSEIYSEPFSELNNYTVSFSGTDGFALLDRLNYVSDDGSKISGASTQFEILRFIIEKMSLPLIDLRIKLTTQAVGVTLTSTQTILNGTFVQNANFYNEDGDPETLRTVLEQILRPYGAFIQQDGGGLYITDINCLAIGEMRVMQRYSLTDFSYIDTDGILANIGDLSSIGFTSSDQTLSIIPGINKQVIKYSPYRMTDILDFNSSDDFSDPGSVTNFGVAPYRWKETQMSSSKSWDRANSGQFIKMEGVDDVSQVDHYLKINGTFSLLTMGTQSFALKTSRPSIIPANYKLRVSMNAFFRDNADLENPAYVPALISEGWIWAELIIGNKKWHNNAGSWGWVDVSDASKAFFIKFMKPSTGHTEIGQTINQPIEGEWISSGELKRINGKFETVDYEIPLDSGFVNGTIDFNIMRYIVYNMSGAISGVSDCRIKDIKLTLIDNNGNEVSDQDFEYVGYMNKQYKETGDDITLLTGTNIEEHPTERGGLLKWTGTSFEWLKEWTRGGSTDCIENLLLRSFVGNYEGKTLSLTCSTSLLPRIVGYLRYSNYLTQKFMITGCTHFYADNSSDITLQEINIDSLTINKTF